MMAYVDTDFFLAMTKKEDWLKSGAEKIYSKNKGKIDTSIIERLSITEAMQIAHNIKHEGVNVFDAFHAALAVDREIISSDIGIL